MPDVRRPCIPCARFALLLLSATLASPLATAAPTRASATAATAEAPALVELPVPLPVTVPVPELPGLEVPLVALPPIELPDLAGGLLGELPLPLDGLGGLLGDLPGLIDGLGGLLGGTGGLLDNLSGLLDNDLGRFLGNLGGLLNQAGGGVTPIPGTESFAGTIEWQGQLRRYVGIRPIGAPAGAPVLALLHARDVEPGRMINIVQAGRLAVDYGAWVFAPAAVGGVWADNPDAAGADDAGFIDALLARELAANGLDAQRVYAAGYSNGAFMAERLACEHPDRLAGLAIVAATLREPLAERCTGRQRIPTLMFNGTSDSVTPYDGLPTLISAPATAAFWADKNQCAPDATTTEALPDVDPFDGTRVSRLRYDNCVDSTVQLYTITGGGHTWPNMQGSVSTAVLGRISRDIDATVELWQQLLDYALPTPVVDPPMPEPAPATGAISGSDTSAVQ